MRKQLLTVTLSAAALFATQAWAAGQTGQAAYDGAGQQAAAQQEQAYGTQAGQAGQVGQQQAGMQQQKQDVPMRASQEAIREIQTVLQNHGHYDGQIDGLWGPQTQAAVRDFQEQQGFEPTGHLNFSTIAALDLDLNQLATQQAGVQPGVQDQQFQDQQAGVQPGVQDQQIQDQQVGAQPGVQDQQFQDQQAGVQPDMQDRDRDPQQAEQRAADAPDQTLPLQLSGSSILEIQRQLQQAGHYDGELDGLWGPRTEQAVRDFQQDQGIDAEGLSFETLAAMDLDLQQLADAETAGVQDQQAAEQPGQQQLDQQPGQPGQQ